MESSAATTASSASSTIDKIWYYGMIINKKERGFMIINKKIGMDLIKNEIWKGYIGRNGNVSLPNNLYLCCLFFFFYLIYSFIVQFIINWIKI